MSGRHLNKFDTVKRQAGRAFTHCIEVKDMSKRNLKKRLLCDADKNLPTAEVAGGAKVKENSENVFHHVFIDKMQVNTDRVPFGWCGPCMPVWVVTATPIICTGSNSWDTNKTASNALSNFTFEEHGYYHHHLQPCHSPSQPGRVGQLWSSDLHRASWSLQAQVQQTNDACVVSHQ